MLKCDLRKILLRLLWLMTVHLISEKLETPVTTEPIGCPTNGHRMVIKETSRYPDHSVEYNKQTESMTLNPKPAILVRQTN